MAFCLTLLLFGLERRTTAQMAQRNFEERDFVHNRWLTSSALYTLEREPIVLVSQAHQACYSIPH